ncbi:hypothetical protein D3C84_882410 [compost metagenome]
MAEVGGPDFAGIEQAEDKALSRGVDQADHPRAFAAIGQGRGRNVGHQLQGFGIEYLDPAGHVVGHRDQLAVLTDGAANAVAALDDSMLDAPGQQIDFAQAAVAAEHIGVALVAGEHHRGMGQVTETLESGQGGAGVAFDDLHAARGALHHHPQIAGTAQRWLDASGQQQPGRR